MKDFRAAIVAIADGDGPQGTVGTLLNLCARPSDVMRFWESGQALVLPGVTYFIPPAAERGANGDQFEVEVQFDCWDDVASGGMDVVERLADRLEQVMIEPNFRAQGVDAAPLRRMRGDPGPAEDPAASGRSRLRLHIWFALKRA